MNALLVAIPSGNVPSVVYLLTNKKNGKAYVGKTSGTSADAALKKRWVEHVSLAAAGGGYLLHKAIRKYGPEHFEIAVLSVHIDDESALLREVQLIEVMSPAYNLAGGGGRAAISLARRASQNTGQPTYQGNPCKHGHEPARYTSTRQCCECHRLRHIASVGGVVLYRKHRFPMSREQRDQISRTLVGRPKTATHKHNISRGKRRAHQEPENVGTI